MKNRNRIRKYQLGLNLQTFSGTSLDDLMQQRSNVFEQQQELLNTAESESRELTAEEETKFNNLEQQYNSLTSEIEKEEAKEARKAAMQQRENELNQAQNKPFRAAALGGSPVQAPKKDDGGFANLGEFVNAVRFGDSKGRLNNIPIGEGEGGGYKVPDAFISNLLPGFRNEFSMGTGSEGGYAVPEQFDPNVLQINSGQDIVRSRATVIPAGDPADAKLTMPALDQGSSGVLGGVEVSWIGEGANKPETSASFREVALQPHEVAAHIVITDKLLRNWKAADSFIRNLLAKAMRAAEDIAFLTGNGTNKPLGVANAPGAIPVNRATANQIGFSDVVNMYAKLLPESVAGSVFVANQSALPQIAQLKDGNNRLIFIQGDATKGLPSTLMGIPIIFTGKTSVLGSKGDLMLLDLTYYLIKDGSGPYISASEHVLFRQNKTVIKAFWNVDGTPWVVEPLALEDGTTTVSPYVVLDVPSAG